MLRPWQLGLGKRINPADARPLHLQIAQALVRDIERGRLRSGELLPSTRALAALLGINRKTVVLAYENLAAQGWLTASSTRGTMVALSLPEPASDRGRPSEARGGLRADFPFAAPPARSLALPTRDGLKLDEGAPDGRLFPAAPLARAYRAAVLRASRGNRMQYGDPRGTPALREAIATMLRSERGLNVDASNICVTRGAQHGVFLATQALLEPGDGVIVEALTYEPAVAAFRARGAIVVPVGLDDGGIDVAEVERVCERQAVRALFLTPHHQFPTTVALRPERRLRLLELARRYGFVIIEDDYDHEFHFEGQPLLPMAAYGPDKVFYVGSLSKLALPALRVGYVAAPADVIDAIAHIVSLVDGMGNILTEEAVAELVRNGQIGRHLRRARRVYAARRLRFATLLDDLLGDQIDYRRPGGGLAFWIRFRRAEDLLAVERGASAVGLSFADSNSFAVCETAPRGLRLGFASLDDAEAHEAIASLRRAIA